MNWDNVDQAMYQAAVSYTKDLAPGTHKKNFVFPGAVLLVGAGGKVLFKKAYGCRSVLPELTELKPDMVFDVASLTKAVVTTTLVMQMVDSGQLDVNQRISRIIQSFASQGKENITLRHLLAHCAGYPPTLPYYRMIDKADSGERAGVMSTSSAAQLIYNEIYRLRLDNMPGQVTAYSDIGFILLGHVLETVNGGKKLQKLAQERIFAPLLMRSSGFIDLSSVKRGGVAPVCDVIVPTADCPWRKTVLCGEVCDENAWAMGGVAGHAGLFSTAGDLYRFAVEMINCWHGRGTLFSPEVIRQFWTIDELIENSNWTLGWDTPSQGLSASGKFFSSQAVGHLGYTGCSLWIDPPRELAVILLTNRVHPSAENTEIRNFRPVIHDLVMEALGFGKEKTDT